MKCVTYNVQYGNGADGVFDLDRIIRELQEADIIALQEVERFWPHGGNMDQVAFFRKSYPGHYCVYGPGVDLHLPGALPGDDRRRQFGNLILSRYPVLSVRNHLLPKRGSIGPMSIQRSALEATVRVNGMPLRIYSIHLTHLSAQTRMPQISRILQLHRDALHEGFPVSCDYESFNITDELFDAAVAEQALMFGDFNFGPDSKEYEAIVGPVSDYGGHITSHDGFVDAWCQAGGEKMGGATSDVQGVPTRMDYCFVSASLRDRIVSCSVDDSARGSDHLPVRLEIDL